MRPRDRQEMARLLDERMNRTYTSLSERQELEKDTSLVKSYLVEAHSVGGEASDPIETLRDVFRQQAGHRFVRNAEVFPAEEEGLATLEVGYQGQLVSVFVDYSHPRYWLLHSMSGSNALKWLLSRAIRSSPALDRFWLPADLLEAVANLGPSRGLGLDYDRRVMGDVDLESESAPIAYLKMQLWGTRADSILAVLRRENAFPSETTLSKVKVKYTPDETSRDLFSIDDVKYDGKVTAHGTSFYSHLELVTTVLRMYGSAIDTLESDFRLNPVSTEDAFRIDGQTVHFLFQRQIPNLETFCESLFRSSEPFRLWGVPVKTTDNSYRVRAVDLHVGSSLSIEVCPDFLRIYLPDGSCGNTVLRLYTNLQHYYDARVRAVDESGERVFAF